MISKYSDVTAQAKDLFKASRLVDLASEEYTHPQTPWLSLLLNLFLILLTRGCESLHRTTSPDRSLVNKNEEPHFE